MGKRKGPRKAYLKRFAADNVRARGYNAPQWGIQELSTERAEKMKTGEFVQRNEEGSVVTQNGKPVELWYGGKNPRLAVLDKLEEYRLEQSTLHQRMTKYNHIALLKTKNQEVRLYFSGQESILVEIDWYFEKAKRSVVYRDRKKAIRAFKMKAVCWVDERSSPA